MAHEPNLIPDFTLVIQVLIFLASYLVMRTLVFAPYLDLLRARRENSIGLKELAQAKIEKALRLKHDYELYLKERRDEASGFLSSEQAQISQAAANEIQEARLKATREMKATVRAVTTQMEKARALLLPLAQDLASEIASKLLGKKVLVSASGERRVRASGLGPPDTGVAE